MTFKWTFAQKILCTSANFELPNASWPFESFLWADILEKSMWFELWCPLAADFKFFWSHSIVNRVFHSILYGKHGIILYWLGVQLFRKCFSRSMSQAVSVCVRASAMVNARSMADQTNRKEKTFHSASFCLHETYIVFHRHREEKKRRWESVVTLLDIDPIPQTDSAEAIRAKYSRRIEMERMAKRTENLKHTWDRTRVNNHLEPTTNIHVYIGPYSIPYTACVLKLVNFGGVRSKDWLQSVFFSLSVCSFGCAVIVVLWFCINKYDPI